MSVHSKTRECLEILKRGGVHTTQELAEELNIPKINVSRIVREIRRINITSGKMPYVFTTAHGYSLEAKPSDLIFEANMRLRMSVGVIIGGMPCFNKAKKIASSQLAGLRAKYKPDLIRIGNIL